MNLVSITAFMYSGDVHYLHCKKHLDVKKIHIGKQRAFMITVECSFILNMNIIMFTHLYTFPKTFYVVLYIFFKFNAKPRF